ncbi:MAG: PAS domain-containing protein [Fibrobacteres bacterium]|nr:PAS domain-containing protein [Fibrobacterota bacterium]
MSNKNDVDDYQNGDQQELERELLPATKEEEAALESILKIFLQSAHVDFSHYRQTTILRRICRRISLANKNSYASYLAHLENDPTEIDRLYDDLLLSHTEFFRDPVAFDALKQEVFPKLILQRPAKTPIRIWVAGCSSGEEVYSIAIALHEFLSEKGSNVSAQFFGTDINLRHINKARKGLYSDKIRKNVSPERLSRYFDETPEGLLVTKQIREMCVFATQDMTQDPPFPSIDLVSCRNVLIYFDSVLQESVIPMFHFALKQSGFLLLGSSESMGKFTELFIPVNEKVNLYSKRFNRNKAVYRFPVSHLSSRFKNDIASQTLSTPSKTPGECVDISKSIDNILLETFAPPCIVVDSSMAIRQFRGNTSKYLTPAPGEASLKLSKMTSEGLMPDIYLGIEEAKKKNSRSTKKNVSFKQNSEIKYVDITIVPIADPATSETCFLITFVDSRTNNESNLSISQTDITSTDADFQLQNELKSTKEHLQKIVEEKDEVNQELWAANEEIQSTNEELQSVNEEMEAAKEELEASNEELVTLNEELTQKNNELLQEEEIFNCFLENSPIYIFFKDENIRSLRLSKNFEQMLNRPIKELIGKTMDDLFPSDFAKKIISDDIDILHDGKQVTLEEQFNGRLYTTTKFPIHLNGRPTYLAGFTVDVTEQRKATEELKKSETALKRQNSLLSSLLENLTIGVFMVEAPTGKPLIANKMAMDLMGRGILPNVTKDNLTHVYKAYKAGTNTLYPIEEMPIVRGMYGETTHIKDMEVERPDGTRSLLEIFGSPVKDEDGNIWASLVSFFDIKDRQRMEDELQKAQKLESLGILAGGIAHDFNNLLSGIFGYIELAAGHCQNQKASNAISNALKTMDRARALTGQLLTFSKGGAPVQTVGTLFPFVQQAAQFALSGSNVISSFKINSDLWACKFDKNQIGQIIDNIVINAQQAMPMGGKLSITAENVSINSGQIPTLSAGKYVKISISDNGCGIPKEIQSRIFDPFFTTKHNGHGLGLATCFSIISRHKGTIEVESEISKGSTFHIYLPACIEGYSIEDKRNSSNYKATGTIIVMDDEHFILDIVTDNLESVGYNVICKSNGQEVIDYIKSNPEVTTIKAMIFDLTVPGAMGGLETIQKIRKMGITIPAFVASGYANDPVMANPTEYGFTSSICKPFMKDELVKLLENNI